MPQQIYIITSKEARRKAAEAVMSIKGEDNLEVVIRKHDSGRSVAQNRLSFMWYKERAEQAGTTPDYEHQLCKLRQGCPILISSDSDFSGIYEKVIQPLPYEDRIKAMAYMPITSIMGVKQMSLYLNNVERDSIASGMVLTHPEDLYYMAIGNEA